MKRAGKEGIAPAYVWPHPNQRRVHVQQLNVMLEETDFLVRCKHGRYRLIKRVVR